MRNLIIIFTNIIFLILLASCGGNENVDLAYKSVMGAIGEYGCSNNLETAYADLNDLSLKMPQNLLWHTGALLGVLIKRSFMINFANAIPSLLKKTLQRPQSIIKNFLMKTKNWFPLCIPII